MTIKNIMQCKGSSVIAKDSRATVCDAVKTIDIHRSVLWLFRALRVRVVVYSPSVV